MGEYLDKTGVQTLWNKCKSTFATQSQTIYSGIFQASFSTTDSYKQVSVNIGQTMANNSYKVICQQDGADVFLAGCKIISKSSTAFTVIVQPLENISTSSTVKFDYMIIA